MEDHIIPTNKKMPLLFKLNWWALGFILISGIVTVGMFWNRIDVTFDLIGVALYLLSFLAFVIVHEVLHGLSFVVFSGQSWKTIRFGLVLKNGLAYCISLVPVTIRRARWSLMMPLYVICIPLYLYGIFTSSFALAILAILFASGSVGDIYYLWQLRTANPTYYMMEEEPTKHGYEIGYYLYQKQ